MISLYSVSGEDSDTVRHGRGFHGIVLQRIPFQQKLSIAFLAKGSDGRSKPNSRNKEVFLLQQFLLFHFFIHRSRASILA